MFGVWWLDVGSEFRRLLELFQLDCEQVSRLCAGFLGACVFKDWSKQDDNYTGLRFARMWKVNWFPLSLVYLEGCITGFKREARSDLIFKRTSNRKRKLWKRTEKSE